MRFLRCKSIKQFVKRQFTVEIFPTIADIEHCRHQCKSSG